jgi:CRP-like cAMP-binding protein
LLKEGQVANYIYFIERGLVRSYYLKDGNEVCSWFMKEGDVIISVNSFFNRIPSYEYLQAIEDTTVYFIHYDQLQNIYKKFIEFNIVGRILTEKYYQLSEERLFLMRRQKASERYNHLLEHHPEILQRVPRTYIASYLGITLETLSRINKK